MSELKGQLLGILLTLIAFASIGTIMMSAIKSTSTAVSEKVSEEMTLVENL